MLRCTYRFNEAADLYNMAYTLVDGIIFKQADDGSWSADYCEGMPFDYINVEYGNMHRMVCKNMQHFHWAHSFCCLT
eukprot:SAG11_NODE_27842_length_328_cov_0.903930_1_plen_76_part_01